MQSLFRYIHNHKERENLEGVLFFCVIYYRVYIQVKNRLSQSLNLYPIALWECKG